MNDFELAVAPAELSEAARAAWVRDPNQPPCVGEIWLLSWEAEARALVLVTEVHSDYALGMPVLIGTAFATDEELVLPETVLGAELTLLHRAETGLGLFLFHRNLGPALSEETVGQIRSAAYGETQLPLRAGKAKLAESEERLDAELRKIQELCFIEWPNLDISEAVLNRSALEAAGVNAVAFGAASGLSTPLALKAWRQQETLSVDTLQRLASAFGLSPEELLILPGGENVRELSMPQFKAAILELAANRAFSEREARNAVRSEFALAARSSSLSALHQTLVRDTVTRLLEASRDDS